MSCKDININKRSVNFTKEEEQLLVALVERYKTIIECKKSNVTTWKDKEKAWQKLENEFNAQSGYTYRSAKHLKEKYLNLKKTTKRRFAAEKRNINQTGGGPYIDVPVDDIDLAIKNIIGKQLTGNINTYDCDAEQGDEQTQDSSSNGNIETASTKQPCCKCKLLPSQTLLVSEEIILQIDPSEEVHTDRVIELPQNTAECSQTTTDWSTYSSMNLKRPLNTKLDNMSDMHPKRKAKKKFIQTPTKAKYYISLQEELMNEKLTFVKLQKEKFLEEHKVKMEILRLKLQIKKRKLEESDL